MSECRSFSMHLAVTAAACALLVADGASMPQGLDGGDQRPTSVISGTVLDHQTGQPLRLAIVSAWTDSGTIGGFTLTDGAGRFTIDGLHPSRYRLAVEKSTYVQPRTMSAEDTAAVVVGPGERVVQRPLYLQRGGVVAGIVSTEAGRPLSGATIMLLECTAAKATCERTARSQRKTTDVDGAFRFFGLEPATYVVAADARFTSSTMSAEAAAPAAIDLAEKLLATRSGSSAASAFPAAGSERRAYLTTYYPGTTDIATADRIRVAPGEEAYAAFAMRIGAPATISGVVVDENGESIGVDNLRIFPTDDTTPLVFTTVFVKRDGSFTTAPMGPGVYRLFTMRRENRDAGLAIEQLVRLSGTDIEGVRLAFRRTLSVSGAASTRGSNPRELDLSGVRIVLSRADLKVAVSNPDVAPATLDKAGVFRVTGLMPGRYSVEITLPSGLRDRLWPMAALRGERDALDSFLDVDTNLSDVRILLAPHATALSGTLTYENGSPAPEYSIIVFPRDEELRSVKRRILTVPVAPDGSFEVKNVPPGEYVIASADLLAGDEVDRALLDALVSGAMPFTVTDGSTQQVTLIVRK